MVKIISKGSESIEVSNEKIYKIMKRDLLTNKEALEEKLDEVNTLLKEFTE